MTTDGPEQRSPDKLPDPWLFDSEALLRELDRCREQVLLIPCNGDQHATQFAINLAVDAIWNLTEQLRYLLHLHREGQREFARKVDQITDPANFPSRSRKHKAVSPA